MLVVKNMKCKYPDCNCDSTYGNRSGRPVCRINLGQKFCSRNTLLLYEAVYKDRIDDQQWFPCDFEFSPMIGCGECNTCGATT